MIIWIIAALVVLSIATAVCVYGALIEAGRYDDAPPHTYQVVYRVKKGK